MSKVFIGIPTFNRPLIVRDTIVSVRAQTFGDYRVVVSDNVSSGDAADQVARFVTELGDPRFVFHRQTENGGEYGQGRFFFRCSTDCELLMILHDDDVLLPEYLAEGVSRLESERDAAFFVANAYGMETGGQRNDDLTRRHLRDQGRVGVREGMYDVLTGHLQSGFAPISGTLFRRQALERSGFVDADLRGNYPFEANVFLRLGETAARAWFSPAELMGVRYHSGALRNQGLMKDLPLIETCVRLWSRRRFSGPLERRRRVVLSRYRRAEALARVVDGDYPGARRALAGALRDNPASVKAWALAPAVMATPGALRAVLHLVRTPARPQLGGPPPGQPPCAHTASNPAAQNNLASTHPVGSNATDSSSARSAASAHYQ
jgi:glycosyltransferase involved in cell wall biosynthesis